MVDCGLERVHEVECRLRAGFFSIVLNRGFNVDGGEGAKVNLHRLSSGVGFGLVSERLEVGGVCGSGDKGATSFEERGSEPAAVVVPSDEITHILTRRAVVAEVDLGVDERLEFVGK